MRFNEANQAIHQILSESRVRLNADRMFLIQFRNGAKFDVDAPIFRIYMTHEVVGRGIAPVTGTWSGVPASQVYEIMSVLYGNKPASPEKGRYPCDDCHVKKDCIKSASGNARWIKVKMLEEGMLKSMMIQQGTYNLLVAPLVDNGQIVGFVGGDFRETELTLPATACDIARHTAANSLYELKRAIRDTKRTWLGRIWHSLWQSLIVKRAGTDD